MAPDLLNVGVPSRQAMKGTFHRSSIVYHDLCNPPNRSNPCIDLGTDTHPRHCSRNQSSVLGPAKQGLASFNEKFCWEGQPSVLGQPEGLHRSPCSDRRCGSVSGLLLAFRSGQCWPVAVLCSVTKAGRRGREPRAVGFVDSCPAGCSDMCDHSERAEQLTQIPG